MHGHPSCRESQGECPGQQRHCAQRHSELPSNQATWDSREHLASTHLPLLHCLLHFSNLHDPRLPDPCPGSAPASQRLPGRRVEQSLGSPLHRMAGHPCRAEGLGAAQSGGSVHCRVMTLLAPCSPHALGQLPRVRAVADPVVSHSTRGPAEARLAMRTARSPSQSTSELSLRTPAEGSWLLPIAAHQQMDSYLEPLGSVLW